MLGGKCVRAQPRWQTEGLHFTSADNDAGPPMKCNHLAQLILSDSFTLNESLPEFVIIHIASY